MTPIKEISLKEIWWLRYVKEWLFPVKKAGIDSRRAKYLFCVVFEDKRNSVLLAGAPRSGTTWVGNVLRDYYEDVYAIPRWTVISPPDSRATDHIVLSNRGAAVDRIYNFHSWWGRCPLRGMSKLRHYIIITRDVPTAVYSLYKATNEYNSVMDTALRSPLIKQIVELRVKAQAFFDRTDARYTAVDYAELRTDPQRYFDRIIRAIEGKVNPVALQDAITYQSWKYNPVSLPYRGAVSYKDEMGIEVYNRIEELYYKEAAKCKKS